MLFSLVLSECLSYSRHKCSKIFLFCSLCLTAHFDYETSLIKESRIVMGVGEKNPNFGVGVLITCIWWFFTLNLEKIQINYFWRNFDLNFEQNHIFTFLGKKFTVNKSSFSCFHLSRPWIYRFFVVLNFLNS